MGTSRALTNQDLYLLKELYKAHYTAVEAAIEIGTAYQRVVVVFADFRHIGVKKYDRKNLIPETARLKLNKAA